ncbi:MAG: HAD family hydrolase [Candidatus Lokiarchaeota archaeon]|nr:HAD family hydrolase [Candidatus Lokiarchaeota archaeon]
MSKKKAIILDRDGVLIEDKNYSYKIEDLEVLPGVIEGLKQLQEEFIFFIVTNQSGIGRGYYTLEDFHKYNEYLISILNENNIAIEKTFFCPHVKEDNCDCRKPNPTFLKKIADQWDVDLESSWMMGDHPSDIQFGINRGCKTVYMITGHGKKHLQDLEVRGIVPNLVHSNFFDAAKEILQIIFEKT